ncbi:MAG TPA: acyl-CoA dehydrogenase family protein, partial [Polyangiaceae bacterium]|nr:acyl-CoA dehydrogenase family protein [Polyangiaceae bacterium]
MNNASVQEQESIRQSARAFVRERAPVAHFRELRDTKDPLGFSLDLWLDLAKLGFPGLVVPEAYGGAGLGYAELGIVAEELGRNLVPSPIVANVLGAGAVMLAGTESLKREVLPGVCTGERVIGLAGDEGVRFAPYAVTLRAERRDQGFVLHGEKSFVLDGYVAGSFVVVARTSGTAGERDGLTLLHALADDPGVTTTTLETVDARSVAKVRFD